jgi:hypothetical protein
VAMQLLVGGNRTMIAAAVQGDIDGIQKWSHRRASQVCARVRSHRSPVD